MEILRKSGLPIIVAEGMNDAAKKVVEAVKALEKSWYPDNHMVISTFDLDATFRISSDCLQNGVPFCGHAMRHSRKSPVMRENI